MAISCCRASGPCLAQSETRGLHSPIRWTVCSPSQPEASVSSPLSAFGLRLNRWSIRVRKFETRQLSTLISRTLPGLENHETRGTRLLSPSFGDGAGVRFQLILAFPSWEILVKFCNGCDLCTCAPCVRSGIRGVRGRSCFVLAVRIQCAGGKAL